MMAGKRRLAVLPAVPALLLVALALGVLTACAGWGDIPPCTPLEDSDVDPCEVGAGRFRSTFPYAYTDYWPGNEPGSIQTEIEGSEIHLVMRATYLPHTVRCTMKDGFRSPPFDSWGDGGLTFLCFSDIRVNDYMVGSGPSNLTVVIDSYRMPDADEEHRLRVESWLGEVVGGREKVMFIGVETDHSVEAFKIWEAWDIVRNDDGAAMVHHPRRSYWLGEDAAKYRSKVEWTLDVFKEEARAAHNARNEKYDGRVADGTQYPRIIANVSNLHEYYVETGAVNHPDGPPERELPPACGKAVPNYGQAPGLLRDCRALLAAKDALRGTGTLDWGVDTTIAEWDGLRVEYDRVVALSLDNKSLSGTIPPELGRLGWLEELRLSGNSLTGRIPPALASPIWLGEVRLSGNNLTGCIPVGLRDVPNHDLDQLGLPDCAAE